MMTIGSTIRQLRQEQDITQEQLAEALGITSRAVSQWECDRTTPDISQLPALANFFDVTTDHLLGVDISRKEYEISKILKHIQISGVSGDREETVRYLRKKLKIYPNEPVLLCHLASALQDIYFRHGKADTDKLKDEISDEIISLCERALRYYKPTEDNSFPKQLLIFQYEYMNEKEKAKAIISSLPYISCTREMLEADVFDGKEALEKRQSALFSLTAYMHKMFYEIYRDASYSNEQKTEILKADSAMIDLITGGKPRFFHGALAVNAAEQAVLLLKTGNTEKALDMLEAAYFHAHSYESRPDGEKYAPCWLSELYDKSDCVVKTSTDTAYDYLYKRIIDNDLCKELYDSERFEKLFKNLKEKISR